MDFEDFRQQSHEHASQRVNRAIELLRELQEAHRNTIGDCLDEMLVSCEATWRFVAHPEQKLRTTAISLLGEYWSVLPNDPRLPVLMNVVKSESVVEVKNTAITVLSVICQSTNDLVLCRVFAALVKDEDEIDIVRQAAYRALCRVVGRIGFHRDGDRVCIHPPRVPDDVDWEFVNRVADNTKGEGEKMSGTE